MIKKAIVMLLTVTLILTACTTNNTQPDGINSDEKTTIFLSDREGKGWVSTEVSIHSVDDIEIVEEVIHYLSEGVNDTNSASTIPDNIQLIDVKLNGVNLILNFDAAYNDMDTVTEIICRTSLVKSLTLLEFIDTVEIHIEDEPLKGSDGAPLGAMGPNDLILGEEDLQEPISEEVTLYFGDKEGSGLIAEIVEVDVNPDEPLEKTILGMLIAGPKSTDLVQTIPVETKIREVSVSDGVCVIDFSTEFKTKHIGGSAGEMLTIYSIVNTLTELPNINKVQFLIEGEKQEVYKGHLEFDIQFERNLDIILEGK